MSLPPRREAPRGSEADPCPRDGASADLGPEHPGRLPPCLPRRPCCHSIPVTQFPSRLSVCGERGDDAADSVPLEAGSGSGVRAGCLQWLPEPQWPLPFPPPGPWCGIVTAWERAAGGCASCPRLAGCPSSRPGAPPAGTPAWGIGPACPCPCPPRPHPGVLPAQRTACAHVPPPGSLQPRHGSLSPRRCGWPACW